MTTLPLTVPYTFGNTTTQNQLTYLDTDFTTIFNAVNGIGNGSVTLSTPVITGNANFTSGTTNFGPFANSNGPNLYLINTNSVSNSGGSLVFLNNNTSAVQKTAAYINGGLLSATAGAEQGIIDFEVFDGTNNVNRIIGMQVNASGASGTFAPNTDNYWSLGLSGYRWSYVYAANGVFTGAVTTAALTASSLSLSTALSAANGGTGLTSPGTSGNVLTSNGSAWVSSAPPSALTQPQIQTQILTVGSGTWTAPTGVTKVFVAVVGGGGGASFGYSGGYGGIAIGEYSVTPGTGYSYAVGAGGAGVNSSIASSGSASSFSTLLSATGGGGGNNSIGTGADGTGSSGTLRNASALWAAQSTPLGGLQTTGAGSNAASSWGINSATMAGGAGYPNGGVGYGGNSGGIYLMWVG